MLPKWRSFPPTHCFCASFGDFCSWLGTFRACACIPWLRWWCCLLTQSACPTLRTLPVVVGLAVFSLRASSLAVPALLCGCFVMRWSCVFLLSSCSVRCRRLLGLLLEFASVPLHAVPAAFRGVSCRELPFGGSATFLAPYACSTPAVELCLWGLRCLSCGACFQPCAMLFLRRLRFCAAPSNVGYPSGFLHLFYLRLLAPLLHWDVGWAAALPLHSQCFSCAGWLAGR